MNSKLKFDNTFCVLPWIEKHVDINGRRKFCCYSEQEVESDQSANNLRNLIWQEKQIPNCNHCYNLEKNKTISPRQIETSRWLKDQEIKTHFDKDTCPEEKIIFYDLRADNKCNLACIGCNSDESSLWARELKMPISKIKTNFNLSEIKHAKKIYLAGGEPLIIHEYINLLEFLSIDNPNIEIVINTNLTHLPKKLYNILDKFKNISFTVSVDAYGLINEYHRYPLKWDKFYSNLSTIYDYSVPIHFNSVIDAVSIFGIPNLKTLQHIPNTWNLTILQTPNWLQLANIPNNLKKVAESKLNEFCADNQFFTTDIKFKSRINLIKKEIWKTGNSKLLIDEMLKIDSRRKIKHKDYLGFDFTIQ